MEDFTKKDGGFLGDDSASFFFSLAGITRKIGGELDQAFNQPTVHEGK